MVFFRKNSKVLVEWFLRLSLSAAFFSAVADRFGMWSTPNSSWGNWSNFVSYTHTLVPFLSDSLNQIAAVSATVGEIMFALLLLTNIKTSLVAKCSGCLLVLFGLAMTYSLGIKAPLNYSVFTAAAGAFALSIIVSKPE